MQAYCMKCRTKREMKDAKAITMKNGKPATQGVCPTCGTKMPRSSKRLLRPARAAYKPAVSPAGPPPIMVTSYSLITITAAFSQTSLVFSGLLSSSDLLFPHEQLW